MPPSPVKPSHIEKDSIYLSESVICKDIGISEFLPQEPQV